MGACSSEKLCLVWQTGMRRWQGSPAQPSWYSWCSSWLAIKPWWLLVVGEQQYRRDWCAQSLQVPCLGPLFRGQELLWLLSYLEMPCPCCVMKRKGRDLPWLGPGGGSLEMWSWSVCWSQAPGKPHLLSPLPCVPLAAPGAFGVSQPQLQQGLAQHAPVCAGTQAWSLPGHCPWLPGCAQPWRQQQCSPWQGLP